MGLFEILRLLYASEINSGLSCMWDAGWIVWIGGDAHSPRALQHFSNAEHDSQFEAPPLSEAAEWLHDQALDLYPHSDYARSVKARAA